MGQVMQERSLKRLSLVDLITLVEKLLFAIPTEKVQTVK